MYLRNSCRIYSAVCFMENALGEYGCTPLPIYSPTLDSQELLLPILYFHFSLNAFTF